MPRPNPRDPDQWLPRDLFAAYCGEGSDALLAYYDKAKAKRQPILMSFDWLAVFILPAWLGYRRQWTLWATLVGTVAAVTIFTSLTHIELPSGAFGGALLALGVMARGLLLTNANARYWKLKQRGLADDSICAELANKAERNVGLAFAGLAGAICVQTALVLLLPK